MIDLGYLDLMTHIQIFHYIFEKALIYTRAVYVKCRFHELYSKTY